MLGVTRSTVAVVLLAAAAGGLAGFASWPPRVERQVLVEEALPPLDCVSPDAPANADIVFEYSSLAALEEAARRDAGEQPALRAGGRAVQFSKPPERSGSPTAPGAQLGRP